MFDVAEAFEVDGLLIGGAVAVFTAPVPPGLGDYFDAPIGSQCIVPGNGVFTKQADGSWLRSADEQGQLEEVVLRVGRERELCFFNTSVVKVRV